MEYKRVLFLHHVSCLGGAERYLVSIIEQLDERFEPYFICQNPGALTEVLNRMGVPTVFIKMRAWRRFKFAFLNLLSVWKIFGYCKAHKIDLICCNAYRVAPYAVIAAKRLGIPCVTIVHDFTPVKKLIRFYTFKSDEVVTVSKNLAQSMTGGHDKTVKVIHNGIDGRWLTESAGKGVDYRKELSVSPETMVIGMVANLIPLKGHKVFLDAMKSVAEQYSSVRFVIVGETLDKRKLTIEDLRKYAQQLGIADKTVFTGYRGDVPSVMSAFDIFVHPSRYEAFGRVIAEAMVLAKPVVATRCGGPEEIIEDGKSGLLVPKDDPAAISNAVKQLIGDEALRRALGEEGRKRILEHFSLEKTVKTYNEIFASMVDK